LNSAVLKRNIKKRISMGHPWIYDNEIERCETPIDGSLVDVFTFSGQFVGRGYYNSNSIIRIRLLTRKNVSIDREFFKEKFSKAYRSRESLLRNSNAARIVFGEADGLPGLIVDKFSDYLVVQFNTLGINTFRDEIVESLVKLFNPTGIFEKSEGLALSKEGLERKEEWIHGKGPELIPFVLNGIKFLADTKGQKTGFFLDQRENALRLSSMSGGGRVIDLFSYTGNFALHCLAGGARAATLVDVSQRALDVASENASLNGWKDRCTFITANAFDFLRESDQSSFDIIVIDPPAMAKSSSSKANALRGYKELNLRAIKSLRSGRLLATSSCTQILSEEEWQRSINDAFQDSKKLGIVSFRGGQPSDHPEVSSIYETKYLKFLIYRVFGINEF